MIKKDGLRSLHLISATGACRVEQYDGREHLVVPVVPLIGDQVIHAVNSDTPEYVPADTLSRAPHQWNGRPLVLGHPTENGKQISANDPKVMERQAFGFMAASHIHGKRLGTEAWIDTARFKKVAALQNMDGPRLLEDIRNNRPIEVSVGAYVTTNSKSGTHLNKPYQGEWTTIAADHLAFLPNGRGACSCEMGCGTGRMAAVGHLVTAEGYETDPVKVKTAEDSGHDFHGNQYSSGSGGSITAPTLEQRNAAIDQLRSGNSQPNDMTLLHHVLTADGRGGLDTLSRGRFNSQEKAKQHLLEVDKHLTTQGFTKTEHPQTDAKGVKNGVVNVEYKKGGTSLLVRDHSSGGYMGNTAHEIHYERSGSKIRDKKGSEQMKGLRDRVKALLGYQIPPSATEAAAEEASELLTYQTVRELLDQAGSSWDTASGIVDDLIKAEEEDPTTTPEDEDAETEIEAARWESLQVLCSAMISSLSGVMTTCYKQTAPDYPQPSDARYAELIDVAYAKEVKGDATTTEQKALELRTAIGKKISAATMKTLQDTHDSLHAAHGHAVSLGATCNGMRLLAGKMEDCTACGGSGNKDGNPCEACDGSGEIKTAAEKKPCGCGGSSAEHEGDTMTKEVRTATIKGLLENKHSGFVEADAKMLETASDERLEQFKAAAEARVAEVTAKEKLETDLKTANESIAKLKTAAECATCKGTGKVFGKECKDCGGTGELKAAAAKELVQLTEEEFLQTAPESIRTLVADKKAADAARKNDLVTALKTAGALTEDQLKAKSLEDLEVLAKFAQVEMPADTDFSGRGIPVARAAGDKDPFLNPPNPYAPGVEKLRAANASQS